MPNVRVRQPRPRGSSNNPVRSVRVEDDLWEKAKRRAAYEGLSMSQVLYSFVEGYAKGMVNAPRLVPVYGNTGAVAPKEESVAVPEPASEPVVAAPAADPVWRIGPGR